MAVYPDRTRAPGRAELDALFARPALGLRERTLYRLLYESAARAQEVLVLDVVDLDLDLDLRNRRAKVRRKGGAAEVIVWSTTTAQLAGGPWTLHQLRHSALTHAAEDGANTSTLLAYSDHTSVASLARYARVSPEALARWQEGRDPAARRR
ncbi:tyrosine-type recombinase/integrase [Streptosporangium sp. NBC_01756]|uniref:tyrosine-type recombinase/integrase n=1 Tax=Streptosporangium sp. NBC_01756 TaxID=2975950 RepID=UPI002DD9BF3A|nr:tyrosine-type recombinase/integrase [Streptosporangium sp. NBC_01756]WSC85713.1 site-specific integrase [Streptosporangium sp. NBC_01756]